ncbi:MAG TPA: succinyl-diaminopimelate desuccinylase [Thermoleophilaceae bacterium]
MGQGQMHASAGSLIADRLAERTLALVDIRSESHAEDEAIAYVLETLRAASVPTHDAGDSCVLAGTTTRGERPLVLLAGHLDTVPAQDNWPGRRGDGLIEGLGASDMKSGVAVMLELALAQPRTGVDVGYVFFGREEVPAAEGALQPLLARTPELRKADLAIMLEPTANAIHAGCLGNINARWSFQGRSGHSARPWLADNAIERAARAVLELASIEPDAQVLDGLTYTQVVSVTTISAGVARNVIPGLAEADVNFRYSPALEPEQAELVLRGWCEPHGELELLSNSRGVRAPVENPLVAALAKASGTPILPKQAWTPVADFAAFGIDAVNLGPGDPALAHRRDEHVTIDALTDCHAVLESFLCR